MKNEIWLGDCLELMKNIPDKSIDCILCDLPFGTTRNKWDCIINLKLLWAQYERIITDNGAICLFAQLPFDKVIGCSNIKLLKYEWIIIKNIATGHLNANKMPMKAHTNLLIFYKKLPIYNPQFTIGKPYKNKRQPINDNGSNYGYIERIDTINSGSRYPKDILYFNREIGLHPTQKSIEECVYFIKTYTNEGDLVLDNCAGSGTTGVACLNTNRQFILIEKEESYFNIIKTRIAKRQEELANVPHQTND